jgi:hypothetical protein
MPLHLKSYVYVLFFTLLYIGIKRCFPREIPPVRPLLSPIVFVVLGIASLNSLFPHAGFAAEAAALAALAAGSAIGWQHARRWHLQFNRGPSGLLVRLPGDASLLITLMLTFASETYMHYAVATERAWAETDAFIMLSFATWGLLIGMPLGRAINVVVRCIRHSNGSRDNRTAYPADSH